MSEPISAPSVQVVENIYALRSNFLIIGLTGRTGSGCTTVAEILAKSDISGLHSNHQTFRRGDFDDKMIELRITPGFCRPYYILPENVKPTNPNL